MKAILLTLLLSILSINCVTADTTSKEQTLSIIKPDAVEANHIGEIIARFEKAELKVVAIKMVLLTKERAQEFYGVHKDRPFFKDLTEFMTSGPIVAMVLEGNSAIVKNRQIMGATDFKKASPGTIRADFAGSLTKNAVHGSDSIESAKTEIAFFFSPNEIYSR